ncbi:hypothetical protein HPB49_001109 [Dermacentor silvarum]|uniref:Uncharacterized protein n=1 Tax=Dermacentor silvarum TaxID=543639 RepID=A0ACB8D1H4_DERSI|nr:hypothetical protein HPB49_001109 [Dermacentor silvarum]
MASLSCGRGFGGRSSKSYLRIGGASYNGDSRGFYRWHRGSLPGFGYPSTYLADRPALPFFPRGSENMLSFLSFLLVASSAVPVTLRRFWEKERRMLVWGSVSRDLPWAVVIVNSTVQLATRVVEASCSATSHISHGLSDNPVTEQLQNNNLLETGFNSLGVEFWTHNSPLANQLLLGAIGSVLAEVTDNNSLNGDLMPFVVKIAKVTAVEPWLYVVPAALGACTNMILPIHLPMIVAHEVVDVPILQLVLIATIAKTVIVLTSVFSINTYGVYLLDWAALQANTTNVFE